MKSYRQQKRKVIEVTGNQDGCLGVSVKKSVKGAGGRGSQKAAESMTMPKLEPQIQLQILSAKIKLQLFPVNETTRLGLEKDGHNPFLELTLSARKKISSVVRHMNTKWGSSKVAIGQLMLFPYATKPDQPASCRRWTSNDTAITAGDVYVALKSPSIFRLRYGWCCDPQLEMSDIAPKSCPLEVCIDTEDNNRSGSRVLEIQNQEKKFDEAREDIQKRMNVNEVLPSVVKQLRSLDALTDCVDDEVATDVVPVQSKLSWDDNLTNLSIGGLLSLLGKMDGSDIGLISEASIGALLSEASLPGKISNPETKSENKSLPPILLTPSDISIGGLLSEASLLSNKRKSDTHLMEEGLARLQSPWDDNLTSLSIGGLFSEASLQIKAGCNVESKSNLQPNAPLTDSLDAFIAAQLNTDSQVLKPTCHEPNLSILDAEDTCHAFPVQKLQPSSGDALTSSLRASTSRCSHVSSSEHFQFPKVAKVNNETVFANDFSPQEMKKCSLGALDEDNSLGLSGIPQNESRGPFEPALPPRHVAGAAGDGISAGKYV